jgi:hypothetical protein
MLQLFTERGSTAAAKKFEDKRVVWNGTEYRF